MDNLVGQMRSEPKTTDRLAPWGPELAWDDPQSGAITARPVGRHVINDPFPLP